MKELRAVPNIDFRGPVSPDTAQRVIEDAAILLSTSDEEGFPNTFLQAWASGTPVVTLKIDPESVIKQKGLGTVSNNVNDAVAAITTLMDSPQKRDEIAHRAHRHVADAHSEKAAAMIFERAVFGVSGSSCEFSAT